MYVFFFLEIVLTVIFVFFAYYIFNERKKNHLELIDKSDTVNGRIKGLTVIYNISTLFLEEDQCIDVTFFKLVDLIKLGWQYPEICEVKLTFEGKEYNTKGYEESGLYQRAEINLSDGRKGLIEIVYLKEKIAWPHVSFLPEEDELLKVIVTILEGYLCKIGQIEKLKLSEGQFRTAFEQASIGKGLLSLDGSWIKVNKALCDMLGYSEEEFLHSDFKKMTYPEDVDKSFEIHTQFLNTEHKSYKFEKRYLHKNGSVVWGNLNTVVIRDDDNNPLYFVAQIENITDRIESQTIFKDLVEKSIVGVYIVMDDKLVYANPQLYAQLGYLQEDFFIGMPLQAFIFEEDLSIVNQNLKERIEGDVDSIKYEVRLKKKDGSVVWNELYAATTIYKGKKAAIGTVVDISDKKCFYDELQKSEANMKSIFDSTEVSFVLIDVDFKIVSFNDNFRQFHLSRTGNEPEVGKNHIDQISLVRRQIYNDLYVDAFIKEAAVIYEEEYLNDDKLPQIYSHAITPVKNNGVIIGLCIATTDITSQKRMEIERIQIIDNLTQRNNDLEQFSYIVSHNIRMPLSNLLGFVTLLQSDISEEDQVFFNEAVKESVLKLDDVVTRVNEILSIRKNQKATREIIEIEKVVEKVQLEFLSIIDKTNAKIDCNFDEISTLYTVETYFYSVLWNLISNSLKFTVENIAPEIKIWTEQKGEYVEFFIQDNGIGIDLEKNGNKIFGIYKRFDLSKEGKGTGLFMVKNQIAALNGTIRVESRLGQGSLFVLSLPLN